MKNLEQIRARNALAFAANGPLSGDKGGEVIKKIPSLIINHGLLATAAYSFTEKESWQKVFDAIAQHLADPDVGVLPRECTNRQKLMDEMTGSQASSERLKQATTETMAWLSYARRFVKKNNTQQGREG
jgi:CRISPR/Cas system CMR-associated protein Cmr5 small subunit